MPLKVISHNVDSIAIEQRLDDGYVNLTAMAKANNKLIADYLKTEQTKAFLSKLAETMEIPTTKLVQVKTGKYGGTWGHPQVPPSIAGNGAALPLLSWLVNGFLSG